MTPEDVRAAFTLPDGGYRFARWRRPIAPVVFGVDDATLAILKCALTDAAGVAGHPLAETDPEQGANLMIFFARDWAEVGGVPDLDGLVPGMVARLPKLTAEGASQYIHMRFEPDGAIRAAICFVVLTGRAAEMEVEDLARALAQRLMLAWACRPRKMRRRFLLRPTIRSCRTRPMIRRMPCGSRRGRGAGLSGFFILRRHLVLDSQPEGAMDGNPPLPFDDAGPPTLSVVDSVLSRTGGLLYRCLNDRDCTMMHLEGAVAALTGHEAREFLAPECLSFSKLIHEADRDAVYACIDRAVAEGTNWSIEYRLCRGEAGDLWVRETGGGVFDADGRLLYLEGIVADYAVPRAEALAAEALQSELAQKCRALMEDVTPVATILRLLRLLAINARIEAARAGAAGAGFAVVAAEIGRLADESTERTARIGALTRDLGLLLSESRDGEPPRA